MPPSAGFSTNGSSEQAWDSGTDHAVDPAGGWPAELGWSTYLGPGLGLPAPPSAEIADRTRRLANGALLITLLDDPAAVDVLRYEEIHTVWGRFVKPDDCRRASMGMRGGSAI
ncbi:hypothetical protein [Actinoplanes solisilvae]|uniref:hypothetical protein n=1 Tax=Actinoplanes solisilvae TaxID=2486853 RepID=UPI000FD7EE8F|nr:hypothetical protein [Actinoplanes solisilvae]